MAKRKLTRAKAQTVRERTLASEKQPKRRLRPSGSFFKRIGAFLSREYYLPMPDNKIGRFLNKKRHFFPRYFRESAQELKQVTWPSRKETWKLTLAVFLFAIIFGLLVAVVDYGLDKLFRKVILKV